MVTPPPPFSLIPWASVAALLGREALLSINHTEKKYHVVLRRDGVGDLLLMPMSDPCGEMVVVSHQNFAPSGGYQPGGAINVTSEWFVVGPKTIAYRLRALLLNEEIDYGRDEDAGDTALLPSPIDFYPKRLDQVVPRPDYIARMLGLSLPAQALELVASHVRALLFTITKQRWTVAVRRNMTSIHIASPRSGHGEDRTQPPSADRVTLAQLTGYEDASTPPDGTTIHIRQIAYVVDRLRGLAQRADTTMVAP